MKILVTGGSGFIGTNLVLDLLRSGHTVSIYDKVRSATYGDLCVVADVRDRERLTEALRGTDAIYHLAAEHRDDVRPVSLYYDVNVGGAENLVYAAKKNRINRMIFTSTVALYGLNAGTPDEESPKKPFNDYSESKHQAEAVFNEWVKGDDSRSLVIVRPVVIFGERNRGNVYELLSQIASGKFIMVGTGKNKKSMGYVLNLSRFLIKVLELGPGQHINQT
jgi:nucleoside-diphosphate-sugar epimerase